MKENVKKGIKGLVKATLWAFVVLGLVSMGIIVSDQKTLYLPQYGQSYWWAWKTAAFEDCFLSTIFVLLGFISFAVVMLISAKRKND